MKLKKYSKGFTLLELVIVMAMIGILSGASFKLMRFSDTYTNLGIVTAEVKGAIRTAQTLALAPPIVKDPLTGDPRIICGFGVRNGSGIPLHELQIYYSYGTNVKDCRGISTVAEACAPPNGCLKYELKDFTGFSILNEFSAPPATNVFFRSPYGKVFGSGTIKVEQDSNGIAKGISINSYGKID